MVEELPALGSQAVESSYAICYWLDVGDVIVEIGPGWEAFARENSAPDLDVRRVIGRNLIDFVSGDASRMYVRTLIQAARLMRRPLIRPYRCDSADTRRYMEMRLTLQEDGLLKWEHRLVRKEAMRRRMDFRASVHRLAARCVVRCSMCNRLKSSVGWSEPDIGPMPAIERDGTIPVIYGVCPDCLGTPLIPATSGFPSKVAK
jgi:hypothetical protein